MKIKFSRVFDEYRNTTNRTVFNRVHKHQLDKKGEIRCSRCPYHRGENDVTKYYGEVLHWRRVENGIRYPNWKLYSKKRKQWMDETYRKQIRHNIWNDYDYVEFKF